MLPDLDKLRKRAAAVFKNTLPPRRHKIIAVEPNPQCILVSPHNAARALHNTQPSELDEQTVKDLPVATLIKLRLRSTDDSAIAGYSKKRLPLTPADEAVLAYGGTEPRNLDMALWEPVFTELQGNTTSKGNFEGGGESIDTPSQSPADEKAAWVDRVAETFATADRLKSNWEAFLRRIGQEILGLSLDGTPEAQQLATGFLAASQVHPADSLADFLDHNAAPGEVPREVHDFVASYESLQQKHPGSGNSLRGLAETLRNASTKRPLPVRIQEIATECQLVSPDHTAAYPIDSQSVSVCPQGAEAVVSFGETVRLTADFFDNDVLLTAADPESAVLEMHHATSTDGLFLGSLLLEKVPARDASRYVCMKTLDDSTVSFGPVAEHLKCAATWKSGQRQTTILLDSA